MTPASGPAKTIPEPVAELREGGVLGDEAPADPRRVRTGLHERALEALVVEVGADAGRRRRRSTIAGPRQWRSSAWRTNSAWRSSSV